MIKNLRRYLNEVLSNLDTSTSTLCVIAGLLQTISGQLAVKNDQQERIASAVESIRDMQRAQLTGTHPHLVR